MAAYNDAGRGGHPSVRRSRFNSVTIAPASTALAAALLFGASTPLAKLLVDETPPLLLAGVLYLGSGIGLAAVLAVRRVRTVSARSPHISLRMPADTTGLGSLLRSSSAG